MTAPLLLDTCAVIWISSGQPVQQAARDAMRDALANRAPVYLSPITAWELGLLMSRGRLPASINERAMLARLTALPGVAYANMSPNILIDSSYLPGPIHKDPADRIIIATARAEGLTIITRDQKILDYAKQGHVNALKC
ncbi:MAG: PIN domain-containing protein [Rhodobacteraceae bacterium]|nr:PIN domain-containing protein [Paracoccaceae bacterium]